MIIGRNAASIGRRVWIERPVFDASWFTVSGPSAAPSCAGSTGSFAPVETHEST